MSEKKVAVITGGNRGIGLAIAEKFAKNGYDIAITYVASLDKKELEKHFNEFGAKLLLVESDVSNFASCEETTKKIMDEFGRIDVLVNNAGITKDNLLLRMPEEDFDKVISVNLKGTFNMCKHVSSIMMKQKYGKIVNISSVVGVCGNAGQVNYSASKAGVIGITKSMAKELASRNIYVNAVAPGFIKTNMTEVLSDKVKEGINAQIPLKRMGEAEEIAKVVYFLGSDESSYVTGQVINVDGGMVM